MLWTKMFKDRTLLFLLCFALFGWLLYELKSILMPFIIAIVFAYLLDPLVRKLHILKVPRAIGTIIVVLGFFFILSLILMMIAPIMYNQGLKLMEFFGQYKDSIHKDLVPMIVHKAEGISPDIQDKIKQSLSEFSSYIVTFAANLLKSIFHSSVVAVNILSLIFITPIVTFYVLKDWDHTIRALKKLIPIRLVGETNKLWGELNNTLSGYLRGQIYVCIILGIYYGLGLSFLGVESGFSLGVLSGIFTFIPYIGVLFGAILAIIVAGLQFHSLTQMLLVAAVFVIGQIVEGNFITPKLIGEKVGLHPVWIMFGLLAGGTMFGFTGILIAVPLTAALGVVIRFAIAKYERSEFYKQE